MKRNDIIMCDERQPITTIVWSGDYPAAQQLTSYLVDCVESGVFSRDYSGMFTDASGERMRLRLYDNDLQAAKFWFGDKVVLRNYHANGNPRNITKDVLALTARMLKPIFADRDAAEQKAANEARKARDERLKLDIKQLLPASGESISFIDFASAVLKPRGYDAPLESVDRAGSALTIMLPSAGITDFNYRPDAGAMSEIAGRVITFDRASGMLRGEA